MTYLQIKQAIEQRLGRNVILRPISLNIVDVCQPSEIRNILFDKHIYVTSINGGYSRTSTLNVFFRLIDENNNYFSYSNGSNGFIITGVRNGNSSSETLTISVSISGYEII
jgi:hypothetical protein